MSSILNSVAGALLAALRSVPRWLWFAGLGTVMLLAGLHWHRLRVDDIRAAGRAEQAAADRLAATRAADAQQRLVESLAARQSTLSKGTADALSARFANLARRYDALRLRWDAGRAGDDQPASISGAARRADDAACAAAGWVSLDTAAAAALAADQAIAKDDAWIAWAAAQQAAWPGDGTR